MPCILSGNGFQLQVIIDGDNGELSHFMNEVVRFRPFESNTHLEQQIRVCVCV